MEVIKQFLSNHVPVSEIDWNIISDKFICRKLPKKTILLRTGEIENHIHFLERGVIREYMPQTDSELTFDFTFQNQFFSAYWSFLHRSPNQYHMQTLTETTLWSASYQDLQQIYQT
ncbi:MAG: cyclic nucleotide-binding domain-containing protein, partial [Cyclobacteriaceae bacterium]